MKSKLYLLLSVFLINCSHDSISCHTELSVEAKEITPYRINQNIHLKDKNGKSYLGVVSSQSTNQQTLSTPGYGCGMYEIEEIETNIIFEDFRLVVKQCSSPEMGKISYNFEYVVNHKIEYDFYIYNIPVNAFRDIIYDGKNFEDVIIANTLSGYIDTPVVVIFSKTKGIEYIQFNSKKTLQLVHE